MASTSAKPAPNCAKLGPADLIPLRAAERDWNVYCSNLHRPTSALLPPAVGAGVSSYPQGFGIYNLAAAYDAYDGYVLLLGANGGPGPLNGTQTWTYTGGNWTERFPASSPESCRGSVLSYDEVDQYVVYFGGANVGAGANCASAGQTWTYRTGTWSHLTPAVSPAPREGAAFTNDSGDGYLLLFGGLNATTIFGDTWSFAGGNWTELFPTGAPSPRSGAGMAYDAYDGYVLLFGGSSYAYCTGPEQDNLYCMDRDTWSFHGGQWSQLSPVGAVPPEPYDDGLVYDAAAHAIFYTVTDDNGSDGAEIWWTFQGGNWTDPSTNGYPSVGLPLNRFGEGLAYDYRDGYDVMYGGADVRWNWLTDTWSYFNGNWTDRTYLGGFSSTLTVRPNATDAGILVNFTTTVYGGKGPFTYSYFALPPGCSSQNSTWLLCTPSVAGTYHVAVSVRNSTGAYANATTTLVVYAPLTITEFSANPSAISLGSSTVFSVGTAGGLPPVGFWYLGLPPGCTSLDVAVLSCTPGTTGDFTVTAYAVDNASLIVNASTTLSVSIGAPARPSITSFTVSPSTVTLGGAVEYVVIGTGTGTLTFTYANLPPGCAGSGSAILVCVPTALGTYVAEAILTDSYGQAAFANVSLVVEAGGSTGPETPLTIVLFLASPAVVGVDGFTYLETFAQGGAPPYSYTFGGLPVGCESTSSSALPCSPTSAGTYSVTVTVTDGGKNTTSATTPLTVTQLVVTGSTSTPSAGPTWLDLGLAILVTGLAVALVAVVVGRRGAGSPPAR